MLGFRPGKNQGFQFPAQMNVMVRVEVRRRLTQKVATPLILATKFSFNGGNIEEIAPWTVGVRDGKMQSDAQAGLLSRQGSRFSGQGRIDHQACTEHYPLQVRSKNTSIDPLGIAKIVGVDDEISSHMSFRAP